MKETEVAFLMEVARLAAARSHAIRKKVGAVVTDAYGNLVSYAYNGTVSSYDNTCEERVYEDKETNLGNEYPYKDSDSRLYRLVTLEDVLHAEQNLLAHAARRGISVAAGTVLVTLSPCTKCTSMMIQAGIKEIIYNEEYRLHSDVEKKYGSYIKFTKLT